MKRRWIDYAETWTRSPMTYWVHIESSSDPTETMPPAPASIPGKGYPVYYVEVDGFTFQFASLDEVQVCIDVLGKKLLPHTLRLARDRDADPDEHWLRKMPERTRPWRYREKAVKYLEKALAAFKKQVGGK